MRRILKRITAATLTASLSATALSGCSMPFGGKNSASGNTAVPVEGEIGRIDVSQYVDGSMAGDPGDGAGSVTIQADPADIPPAESMEQAGRPVDASADAASIMMEAFYQDLVMTADVPGGQLEVGVSGENEYMTLHQNDGQGTASFYILNGTMYMHAADAEGQDMSNIKVSEETFDADPHTETSDKDIIGSFASANDPAKYANAEKLPEMDINGVMYLPIVVKDEGETPTTCYINMQTGKCDYMDMESTNTNGVKESIRFSVMQGQPITEQPWMSNATESDVEYFTTSMMGFILAVFIGDVSVSTGS